MKTNITLTLLLIFTITLASAVTVYSGEPVEIELGEPFEYYSVVGNSTEVELTIIQDGNNVTIIPNKYSQQDSYEVVFFNSEKEVVTVYSSSGGGGGSSYGSVRTITETVTEYVDREVNVTPTSNETDIEGDIIEEQGLHWYSYVLFVICIIIMIVIIYFIFFNERRSNNNEYNE